MFFMAWVASMIVAGVMANSRDRNVAAWVVAAFFGSWIAVLILALLGEAPEPRLRGAYPSIQQNVTVTVPGAQITTGGTTNQPRRKGLPGPLYRDVVELVLADLPVEEELLRARASIVAYRLDNDLDSSVTDDDALAVLERVKVSLGLIPEPERPRSVGNVHGARPSSIRPEKYCRDCGAVAPFGTRTCECGTLYPALTWEEYRELGGMLK